MGAVSQTNFLEAAVIFANIYVVTCKRRKEAITMLKLFKRIQYHMRYGFLRYIPIEIVSIKGVKVPLEYILIIKNMASDTSRAGISS